jgi:hypothetical protein
LRYSRDGLSLSEGSDPLIGFGFYAEVICLYLEKGTQNLFHLDDMRPDLGGFRDDDAVYMMDTPAFFAYMVHDDFQQFCALDISISGIGIRKKLSDISLPDGSQQGIYDGVY